MPAAAKIRQILCEAHITSVRVFFSAVNASFDALFYYFCKKCIDLIWQHNIRYT